MRRLLLLVLFAALAVLAGCEVAPWREQAPPWGVATCDGAREARIALVDGPADGLVLDAPHIEQDGADAVLVGTVDGRERRVPLGQVLRLETRHTEVLRVAANVVVAVVVVAVLVAAIACSGDVPSSLFQGLSIGGPAPRKADGKGARGGAASAAGGAPAGSPARRRGR